MCIGKGRGNGIESLTARQEVWTAKNAVVFQPKNAVHAKGMPPRLVKYANKVLPLLPTWPTNCSGVKDKLLKP